MEILLKHKGFIEMVARDIIRPDESQQVVKDVLAAYSEIDNTAEVLAGCSTCENKFPNPHSFESRNQLLLSVSHRFRMEAFHCQELHSILQSCLSYC